jgi:mannosyl-glycoprotein endo-beta-N-acetylglucosaminidase
VPICKFFPRNPSPNPANLAFYTVFCPGVGRDWYVNGAQVLQTVDGWTDVQKQTSLGDMLWPKPTVRWDGGGVNNNLPDATAAVTMDMAWNGGSCIALDFVTDRDSGRLGFPIQSFALTPGREYDVSLIYNIELANVQLIYNTEPAKSTVQLDLSLSVDPLSTSIAKVSVANTHITKLSFGWCKLSTRFSVNATASSEVTTADPSQLPMFAQTRYSGDVLASVGLKIAYARRVFQEQKATVKMTSG